jgi:hypothetical protein
VASAAVWVVKSIGLLFCMQHSDGFVCLLLDWLYIIGMHSALIGWGKYLSVGFTSRLIHDGYVGDGNASCKY